MGRTTSNRELDRVHFGDKDWENCITLSMALTLTVAVGQQKQTLKWIGENNPAYLDILLGRTNPRRHGELFWSLVKVNEHFGPKIAKAVNVRVASIRNRVKSSTDRRHFSQIPAAV